MRKKWTRRNFLQTSLGSSLALSAEAMVSPIRPGIDAPIKPKGQAGRLTSAQTDALRAAMDEIVPAVDGMPAASEVGGVEYLAGVSRENPSLGKELDGSLAALDKLSRKQFGNAFPSLPSVQRVKALQGLEKQSVAAFALLRDLTYEVYYTRPQVWKLIGYEFHPTNEAGPPMRPFDAAVLAKVRRMPRRYREVL